MSTPAQIGKYAIQGIAGEGNMATVYVGHDPFADMQVAIKVCTVTEGSAYKLMRKLFFNEAHTAGSLEHPNILSVLDAGEHDGQPYIVMEYVQGADTLRSYITPEELLPLPRVVEILYQCTKALDYAHRRGVIHRDIKPSNIMLSRDGVVKIGDFGIAQYALSDETQVLGMLGSPRYMSPEQLREEELTHQTDLFSLGIVAYELVTGRPPFVGRTMAQLSQRILNQEPEPVTDLRSDAPPTLGAIIAKALAKSTDERYEYAHEMAADLASLFGQLEHEAAPPEPEARRGIARELRFFNEFSDEELDEVLEAATWMQVRPGSTIIAESTSENAFYVVASGEVSVRVGNVEVSSLGKGECFGEMGVLSQDVRGASVIARDECTVMRIDGRLLEHAGMSCQLRFSRVFLATLVRRLTRSNQRLAAALSP